MRNFAVKFAILTAYLTGEIRPDPKPYLDLTPEDMLLKYKSLLNDAARGVLLFGFSDLAILHILDEEFEVSVDSGALLFRKTFLDSRSIQLANVGRSSDDALHLNDAENRLLGEIADWLLEATRSLYRPDISLPRIQDVRREYQDNVRIYIQKYAPPQQPESARQLLRALLTSIKSVRGFCHAMTVDALFKADAAKVLFGEQSGYYQAWLRKEIFRHMIARTMEQSIRSYQTQEEWQEEELEYDARINAPK